jgi:ribosomal protein S18 acetylase RimI-like enzyme
MVSLRSNDARMLGRIIKIASVSVPIAHVRCHRALRTTATGPSSIMLALKLELFKCSNADLDELAVMNRQLIVDEGHSNTMNVPQLAERMKGWINDKYVAYVAKLNSELVGYFLVRDDSDFIYIRHLFINESYRRNGFGREIVHRLKVELFKGRKFRMEVLCNNTNGQRFWRKIGFIDYSIMMELNNKDQG